MELSQALTHNWVIFSIYHYDTFSATLSLCTGHRPSPSSHFVRMIQFFSKNIFNHQQLKLLSIRTTCKQLGCVLQNRRCYKNAFNSSHTLLPAFKSLHYLFISRPSDARRTLLCSYNLFYCFLSI